MPALEEKKNEANESLNNSPVDPDGSNSDPVFGYKHK